MSPSLAACAAQAVRNVITEISPAPADEIASAVLRVASDKMMSLIGDTWHSKYMEGIEASSDFLDRIAAELEGGLQTTTGQEG